MIFAVKGHVEQIVSGTKTQTRRLVKPGDVAKTWCDVPDGIVMDVTRNGKKLYALGQTYAVTPGRGKHGVARIKLVQIRREDVRSISEVDAQMEGGYSVPEYLTLWSSMYDPLAVADVYGLRFAAACRKLLEYRPEARWDAWVLTFEAVQA